MFCVPHYNLSSSSSDTSLYFTYKQSLF